MTTADALWTAITSKRTDLLDQTEARLRKLHDEAKLEDDAFRALEAIVAKARANDWSGAVKDLKWFTRGQHRPR